SFTRKARDGCHGLCLQSEVILPKGVLPTQIPSAKRTLNGICSINRAKELAYEEIRVPAPDF
ncbi:MAG: hypothetical protein NC489_34345, partial [Ruminococcus flavefaciens]|nr:hypothetical protein [Ruminococcus flavefaciens]